MNTPTIHGGSAARAESESRAQPSATWSQEEQRCYLASGLWENKSLFHYFEQSVKRFPDRCAIIYPVSLSYAALMEQVLMLASRLKGRGIQAQDKVLIQLPNSPAFVQYFLACLAIGAVPVMALPAHRRRELNYLLDASDARAFISQGANAGGRCTPAAMHTPAWQGEHIVVSAPHWTPQSQDRAIPQIHNPAGSDIALLQLSGGTTGLPKLIPRTHNDYAYSIRQSNDICRVNEHSVFLCVLPASHNFTLSSPGILGTLFAGGALVLADTLSAHEAFSMILRWGITHAALVPPLALNWLHYWRMEPNVGKPLAAMTSLLVGGAKLNPCSAKALVDELGAPLQQVFGMAEGLVNYTRLDDSTERICTTQGRPLSPCDQVLVVDDDDQPVARGEVGHLLTKGPYTIRAYLNAAEHNKRAFTQSGFYRTGDLVSVDKQGNITVEGRAKDQINRGGEKVSAAELENYLVSHPQILDAAVVAIPDAFLGEKTGAFLVIKDGVSITLPECRAFLRGFDIAEFKLPDHIYCTAKLPTTHFGKIDKRALRDWAGAGALHSAMPAPGAVTHPFNLEQP